MSAIRREKSKGRIDSNNKIRMFGVEDVNHIIYSKDEYYITLCGMEIGMPLKATDIKLIKNWVKSAIVELSHGK